MKTVAEILKETGLSDEQITALDKKVVDGFTSVISTASQAQEAAELARRAQAEEYDTKIAPALDNWANQKAAQDTKLAAYEAALKGAAEGGFKVPDILKTPTPTPARAEDGKFVPGQTGSPQFVTKQDAFAAISTSQWAITEYMRLHNGAPPPDDLEILNAESVAQRMPFKEYVAKKYDFAGKREAIKQAEQKKHDDAIAAAAVAENDKKWSERMGSNPNIRQAETSRFSAIDKAVKAGERPDPLKMNREERHNTTRQFIQKEIATSSVQ